MLLMSIIFLLSITFILMNHPLSMGLILLIQTIMISLMTGSLSLNFWYSYILLLIMIGGMLILFIYMTSIASNEIFKPSLKLSMMMMFYLFMMSIFMIMIDHFINNIHSYNEFMNYINNYTNINLSLNKFLNQPMMMIYFILIIYLFITLIATVKITNINYGPLRQKL
uniref:NADH-ubiquinone oxidoreductase chain 6 n=1 Tax=Macrohyliota sp. 1 MJ-2020 TaxID=2762520 RepID=A0A7G7MU80_9CUCU|nr:NADH dehydrogenase subunit 6 [Macrohyliota sp. 1 MJ-2020]